MAEEEEVDAARDEELEEEEPIRIPPGWGPVLFLALVVVVSNIGLGMYVRSLVTGSPAERPHMGAAPELGGPGREGLGGPGGKPGPGGPGEPGEGPRGKGGPDGPATSTFTVDESLFTPELDARLRKLAEENGLPPDDFSSAREVYAQMQRSGLLPQSNEVSLETALTGHILEMAKHRGESDSRRVGGAPGQPGPAEPAPEGQPQPGVKKPPPDGQ